MACDDITWDLKIFIWTLFEISSVTRFSFMPVIRFKIPEFVITLSPLFKALKKPKKVPLKGPFKGVLKGALKVVLKGALKGALMVKKAKKKSYLKQKKGA